jgi:hypothetical protein
MVEEVQRLGMAGLLEPKQQRVERACVMQVCVAVAVEEHCTKQQSRSSAIPKGTRHRPRMWSSARRSSPPRAWYSMSNMSFLESSYRPTSQRPRISSAYVTTFGATPWRAISPARRSAVSRWPSRHAAPTSVLNVTVVGRTPRPSISSSTARAPTNPSR